MPILGTHWPSIITSCETLVTMWLWSPSLACCLPGLKKPQLLLFFIYKVHSVFKGAQLREMSGWFHTTVGLAFHTQGLEGNGL